MAAFRVRHAIPVLVGVVLAAAPVAGQGVPRLDSYAGVAVRILQSNNAGTEHHIIDPVSNKVVGVIRGCPHAHNLTTHPDGLYYYCANEQDKTVDVFDTKTLQKVTSIKLSERPNKIAVSNADGSTKRMFAQATGINAVWVIDWNTRKVVQMLWPPELPLWKKNADGIQTGDMHGLEVLPDRSAVWASSRLDSRIYGWTLPDLKYIGAVEVGPSANWMTPTPDSKFMYVAISGSDHTLAVDLKKLEIVAKIRTGARPARISTAILPANRANSEE
jgi:YVTN family beta-propeller protein